MSHRLHLVDETPKFSDSSDGPFTIIVWGFSAFRVLLKFFSFIDRSQNEKLQGRVPWTYAYGKW